MEPEFVCPRCLEKLTWFSEVRILSVDLSGEPLSDEPTVYYECPECGKDITDEVNKYYDERLKELYTS
jgi:DNA-directed RNA polymerase subunit M/transcription elongation factor TFIIS